MITPCLTVCFRSIKSLDKILYVVFYKIESTTYCGVWILAGLGKGNHS